MSARLTLRYLTGRSKNKEESFEVSEVSFGTGANHSVRFDPAWDRGVAASHARVWVDAGGTWWLEDAGSGSGTWVNGQRVLLKQALAGATVVEFGRGGPKVEVTPIPAAGAGSGQGRGPVVSQPAGQGKRRKLVLAAIPVLVSVVFGVLHLRQGAKSNNDERLKQAAAANAGAVGVVMAVTAEGPQPFATAWAVRENTFATNAHVIAGVAKAVQAGAEIYIVINRQPQLRFRVVNAAVHPRAGSGQLNVQGKKPAVTPWDIGLLMVEGKVPSVMKIAAPDKLKALGSGTRVAYLGFPMEGMVSGGVNAAESVANMQSGIVTSVSDFWLGAAAADDCLLVSHNLGAAGGASGSPVFDADGEVIAVLSAGNVTRSVEMDGNKARITRTPSAVMINFAQRADILTELLAKSK